MAYPHDPGPAGTAGPSSPDGPALAWIDERVHMCPPDGAAVTPCCARSPFELPRTDRLTVDPQLVTCAGDRRVVGVAGENDHLVERTDNGLRPEDLELEQPTQWPGWTP